MKKIVNVALFAGVVLLASCGGCSQSGNRPTGPKTFVQGIIVSVKDMAEGSTSKKLLIDANRDGKGDQEQLWRQKGPAPKKGDTVTLVFQGKHVVEWYE